MSLYSECLHDVTTSHHLRCCSSSSPLTSCLDYFSSLLKCLFVPGLSPYTLISTRTPRIIFFMMSKSDHVNSLLRIFHSLSNSLRIKLRSFTIILTLLLNQDLMSFLTTFPVSLPLLSHANLFISQTCQVCDGLMTTLLAILSDS